MRRTLTFLLATLLLIPGLVLVQPALAQDTDVSLDTRLERVGNEAFQGQSGDELPEVAGNIIKAFLSIFGVLFLALMVYGGYTWLNARGNDQQVEKAKDIITQAVIGLVIVLAAYSITYFVVNALVKSTGFTERGAVTPGGSNRFGTP